MIATDGKTTEEVLGIARRTAEEKGIKDVVIATTHGTTAENALKVFEGSGLRVIAVTHSTGFRGIGEQELTDIIRKDLDKGGIRVITGTMPFHGIEDCLRKSRNHYSASSAMADALRLLGQGTKVCVEITCMAVDAGVIEEAQEVVAIAGTHYGADTVLTVYSACTRKILDLRVREVVAKPVN